MSKPCVPRTPLPKASSSDRSEVCVSVALCGVGLMGEAVGERILEAGLPLTVYNRTPEKTRALETAGANVASDLQGLLSSNAACITVVSDDDALEAVALGPSGLLGGASSGTTLIDMSTVSAAASARIAEAAAKSNVNYLRAPVSGNPAVVRAGNLTIIVSGPEAAFEDARELLEVIGPNVYHVGSDEQARVVKLALQVFIGGTAELLAEALLLAERGGVERATFLEVLGNSAVGSPFVKYKTPALLADDFSATFTTDMLLKDIGLVLAQAESTATPVPLATRLDELVRSTIDTGYADDDFMALYLALRGS